MSYVNGDTAMPQENEKARFKGHYGLRYTTLAQDLLQILFQFCN